VPSFEALYRQYFDFVWSSVRRLGVGNDALDDVVQEIFIVIHSRLHTLEQPESLRSWIYGIVRRTVSGHHRTNRTRTSGVIAATDSGATGTPPATPFELTARANEFQLLQQLLSKLDDAKREVFELVEIEEMSVPEVAAALEIPLNTAYSRLRAARQEFEEALARHELKAEGARRRCQS
jgi:RNA polymerase sigma-70 factor (ECF subfamily)